MAALAKRFPETGQSSRIKSSPVTRLALFRKIIFHGQTGTKATVSLDDNEASLGFSAGLPVFYP